MMVIAFNISNPISLSRKANFKSWFTQGSERHAVVIYYWRINICSFLTTVTKSQIMNQVKLLLLIDKNCLDQYATTTFQDYSGFRLGIVFANFLFFIN